MHELLHLPRFKSLFGAPSNFDSGPCERMHKEVAKHPGCRSQKRHETFSYQAAKRLAEKHVLDLALEKLEAKPQVEEQSKTTTRFGSSFLMKCDLQTDKKALQPPTYNVSIKGLGLLSGDPLLDKKLYPDLVQFIVVYFSSKKHQFASPIYCRSEISDELNNCYRAHHSFHSGSFWHDWAWVSYANDSAKDGYSNVPAKLLCFLPKGVNESRSPDPLVICHPCMWQSCSVSSIARK